VGDREIGVGDRVRSLDFQWPLRFENSYVEGVVLAVLDPEDPAQAFPAYEIRVERRVLGGVEQSDFPDTIYAPVNGLEMPGGARTSGVTLLGPRVFVEGPPNCTAEDVRLLLADALSDFRRVRGCGGLTDEAFRYVAERYEQMTAEQVAEKTAQVRGRVVLSRELRLCEETSKPARERPPRRK